MLEQLACIIIRDDGQVGEAMRLEHFDQRMLNAPAVAAEQLFNEAKRMGEIAKANFVGAIECFDHWDDDKAAEVMRNEEVLDFLNHEITTYLVEVKGLDLNAQDTLLVGSLFHVINDMERGGTYIKSSGLYSKKEKQMIFLVVSRREVAQVQRKVKEIDPKAFLVVTDAYDTYGEGFKPFPDKESMLM